MPVPLPEPPFDTVRPSKPHPFVWLAIFAIILAGGIAYTLLTWPDGVSTHTAKFWLQLLFIPAMIGIAPFGLRLFYGGLVHARIDAGLRQWQEDQDKTISYASEPLALLGSAYVCAIGHAQVAGQIAAGEKRLASQSPAVGHDAVRHTRLSQIDGATLNERFEACFVDLLERLDQTLQALPANVPLEVHVQWPEDADQHEMRRIWRACWDGFGYPPAPVASLPSDESLMMLDAWLDDDGTALEKCVLVVAVRLHAMPDADSAEAAVALLLGWAPQAQRNGMTIHALVHRPVEVGQGTLEDALSIMPLWGNAQAEQIEDLWQAGLPARLKERLLFTAGDLGFSAARTEHLQGIHDVDLALGDAGVAAPWLLLALAAEHAAATGKPQAVAGHRHELRLAMVQPPVRMNKEQGQNG